MNLKSHTAYPEVQIDEGHNFVVRFYDKAGKTAFEKYGKGKNNADARKQAKSIIAKESKTFIIKKEK